MADAKISALTALDAFATGDLLPMVDDPAGTPVTKKATIDQVATFVGAQIISDTAYAASWNGVTDDAPSKNAVYDKIEGDGHPGYVVGSWYLLNGDPTTMAGFTMTANTIYYSLIRIYRRVTLSDLGVRTNSNAASGNIAVAIYAHDAATGKPTGTPLAATSNMSTTTAGTLTADITGANVTFDPGWYWTASWCDTNGAAAGPTGGAQTAASRASSRAGSATAADIVGNTVSFAGYTSSEAYNASAWPDAASETLSVSLEGRQVTMVIGKAA